MTPSIQPVFLRLQAKWSTKVNKLRLLVFFF